MNEARIVAIKWLRDENCPPPETDCKQFPPNQASTSSFFGHDTEPDPTKIFCFPSERAHLPLKPHEAAEQLVVVPAPLLDPDGGKFRFRTRVSADEVARILRRCHAPEPWNNPSACTEIGTLPMRTKPHPAALAVQKALEDLKRAIAEFNDEEMDYFEQLRTANKRVYSGEPGLNEFPRQVSERVRHLSKQLDKVRNIVPGTSKFTVWHWSAAILFEEYKLIVGTASPSADGPAVQFVHLLLIRLGLGERSPAAIEKALRRSSANRFLPSHIFGFESVKAGMHQNTESFES